MCACGAVVFFEMAFRLLHDLFTDDLHSRILDESVVVLELVRIIEIKPQEPTDGLLDKHFRCLLVPERARGLHDGAG